MATPDSHTTPRRVPQAEELCVEILVPRSSCEISQLIPGVTAPPLEIPAMLDRARRILTVGPRPEEYLPVTDEVRDTLTRAETYLLTTRGVEFEDARRRDMLRKELLSFHYGERFIAYRPTNEGVVVLAVGEDQVTALVQGIPDDLSKEVVCGGPEPWL
jgi:hypothetical protein